MKALRLFIYGNILVSISVGVLTLGISIHYSYSQSILYGLCAAFATLFIYNLQRLLRFEDVMTQSSERHIWLVNHKKWIIIISALGLIGAASCYLILGINKDVFLILALTLLGFLYAYQGNRGSALRDLPFIKIYLIALVWSSVSVLWPAFREGNFDFSIVQVFFSVFFFILASTIPFDIRDLMYDHEKQKTIPQLIGEKGSKIAGILLLVISGSILLYCFPRISFSPFFYLSYFGMTALIMFTHKNKKEMYFSGLIDGWIILLGLTYSFSEF